MGLRLISHVFGIQLEAAVQRCSVKKVFLEIRKIHWKTPVPESLFLIKLQRQVLGGFGKSFWEILGNF